MNTNVTLLTYGSVLLLVGACVAVLLVLLTMHYGKRKMLADKEDEEEQTQE